MADNCDSSRITEDMDDDNIITLEEFIEEERRLETDADAVLGPSDDKNCTYNQGYVNRQALYACVTCLPQNDENSKSAGICLACSYHCHEGHDLIELYTKRNFRCDCGNSLFGEKKCSLEPEKDSVNIGNDYNQNFKGVYCTCARPYPDPDDSVADEMLQCIVCEDWYHTRHLGNEVPPGDNYAELICGSCSDKLHFLKYYLGFSVTKTSCNTSLDVSVDVTCGESKEADSVKKGADVVNGETKDDGKESIEEENPKTKSPEGTNGLPGVDPNDKECIKKKHKPVDREDKGATYWPGNFRSLMCTCSSCKDMYNTLGVPWITDTNDTVLAYEEKGKKDSISALSQSDQVMKILSGMDRFQQVEAIQNYNDLKTNLIQYLAKFAENKKVVREEDIHEFFSQMQARKRQKLNTPPYMCR